MSLNKGGVKSSTVADAVTNLEETSVQRKPIERTAVSFSSYEPEILSEKTPGENVDPPGEVKKKMELKIGETSEKDAIDELVQICRA
ncbi:hypothetical protein THAOC_33079 [Thalassiosira oceanica]|uniref:Uncharacterized protein n=1 Tax=Thalassiosira oceanica TaxID=159749 RepID=K0RN31_THAOC|nr:hypothetical protein THAOC_33079 [Thalassiosira oceanica]|eukprot:EJK48152.1 hypothetical protein THAOC_33079 [Thalassiosira oceanica]